MDLATFEKLANSEGDDATQPRTSATTGDAIASQDDGQKPEMTNKYQLGADAEARPEARAEQPGADDADIEQTPERGGGGPGGVGKKGLEEAIYQILDSDGDHHLNQDELLVVVKHLGKFTFGRGVAKDIQGSACAIWFSRSWHGLGNF